MWCSQLIDSRLVEIGPPLIATNSFTTEPFLMPKSHRRRESFSSFDWKIRFCWWIGIPVKDANHTGLRFWGGLPSTRWIRCLISRTVSVDETLISKEVPMRVSICISILGSSKESENPSSDILSDFWNNTRQVTDKKSLCFFFYRGNCATKGALNAFLLQPIRLTYNYRSRLVNDTWMCA